MQHGTAPRKTIFAWTLFDFANTGFYVIIITLVFPIFFKNVIAGGNEAYWGRTISASMLLTALIGPLLGSIADATSRKKMFLGLFTGACVAATAGLYFTGEGTLALAVILVIIANMGFEGGTIFYDALLPEISSEKHYARISGYGFAMGYVGSLVILGIVLPILAGEPSQSDVRTTFVIAAAFFAVFALPLFKIVPEEQGGEGGSGSLIEGYRRLIQTFQHLRQYRAIVRFIVAFFVYNDSILTIILFSSIFASSVLKMTSTELIYFFMIVQTSAIFGSLIFGWLTEGIDISIGWLSEGAHILTRLVLRLLILSVGVAVIKVVIAVTDLDVPLVTQLLFLLLVMALALLPSRITIKGIGARQVLVITLCIWIAVVMWAYMIESKMMFYMVGGLAGIGLGSSQSTSRAMMALLTPYEKKTEFFGFYDGFFGKASAILGPLIFGEVSAAYGLRPAMLVVGGLFVVAIGLVMRIPDVRPTDAVVAPPTLAEEGNPA